MYLEKSTFNTTFKKQTGMTPREFRLKKAVTCDQA
ncbi:MAG: AraC family transcriptional regulator [Desulfomonilia bacterium]